MADKGMSEKCPNGFEITEKGLMEGTGKSQLPINSLQVKHMCLKNTASLSVNKIMCTSSVITGQI